MRVPDWPLGDRYSTCAGLKWKTWERSLVFVTGRHCTVRQRSFHVQVICRRRPLLRADHGRRPGGPVRAEVDDDAHVAGATHFRSATTATRAVIGSPKRCTGGSTEA